MLIVCFGLLFFVKKYGLDKLKEPCSLGECPPYWSELQNVQYLTEEEAILSFVKNYFFLRNWIYLQKIKESQLFEELYQSKEEWKQIFSSIKDEVAFALTNDFWYTEYTTTVDLVDTQIVDWNIVVTINEFTEMLDNYNQKNSHTMEHIFVLKETIFWNFVIANLVAKDSVYDYWMNKDSIGEKDIDFTSKEFLQFREKILWWVSEFPESYSGAAIEDVIKIEYIHFLNGMSSLVDGNGELLVE